MRHFAILLLFIPLFIRSQTFTRSELPTTLTNPWEMTYGPDNFLWLTESGGKVIRVDPNSGAKTTVFTAADYFGGDVSEKLNACFQPNIGAGTLGLTLHPDFLIPGSSYIYYLYSYNSNTVANPITKFKVVRLTWDASNSAVTGSLNLITNLPSSYDHLGGRLLAVKQNSVNYLYLSIGDHGISEDNSPTCYTPQSTNPNNFTQDINYKNGKIHRFNMDGTIPNDNPVSGNSFYTRGHRNPQGLAYNHVQNVLYDIEHGDRTDDEVNVLEKGKNYGWKNVRGYHADNNFSGEAAFVAGYTINPAINGDGLKEAMFSFCAVPQPTTGAFLDWCTVAPSDGIYYNYASGIPGWNNSLLVVSLKNGLTTDMEVHKIQLDASGTSIVPSTTTTPNPQKFFGADQLLNGRLRDIAISPNGLKIFLINNGGAATDKITVYSYVPAVSVSERENDFRFTLQPNPVTDDLTIISSFPHKSIVLTSVNGKIIETLTEGETRISMQKLPTGLYFVKLYDTENRCYVKKIIKN